MHVKSWLLLTYKVPPEPAKKRIALWRKIKSLGAVYIQSGVCLLPKADDHERRLKIIENEIAEMEGEAVILETNGLDRAQEDKVIARFKTEQAQDGRGACCSEASPGRLARARGGPPKKHRATPDQGETVRLRRTPNYL